MIPKIILPRNTYLLLNESDISSADRIFTIILYYHSIHEFRYLVRRLDQEGGWDKPLPFQIWDIQKEHMEWFEIPNSEHQNEIEGIMTTSSSLPLYARPYQYQWIPKNIIQTFDGEEYCSVSHRNAIHSFIDWNPDYTYYYFTDQDCRQFIKTHFELRILKAYDKLIPKALKSDMFRVCFIYERGGCYFDHKQILMKPLCHWIPPDRKQVFCMDQPALWMHNGIFCSVSRAPELYDYLLKMVHLIEQDTYVHWSELTGPRIFYDYTYMYYTPLLVVKDHYQRIIHQETKELILYRCYFNYYLTERKECYDTLYRRKQLFYRDVCILSPYTIVSYPAHYRIDAHLVHKKTKKSIQQFNDSLRSYVLYPDRFDFQWTDHPSQLKIIRTDQKKGWNIDLRLLLIHNDTHGIYHCHVGPNPSSPMKIVTIVHGQDII